eukprot:gnl/TRDRNA2_/TRDRNA2_161290_c0_seq2.p1 gnl/TRDRNA2_/TRDRNA2_161290_c0~~gnl/TRDRNA2_/TRDRNA2_161290_c0_seq2.p1  ORF type:complete len:348 (-),score=71.89 gnl/TRDRNA2_/TRDRNA2_161290_c0_seq2:124-1167(-)
MEGLDPTIEIILECDQWEAIGLPGAPVLDVVLLSCRGTKVDAYRGSHGGPLFAGALQQGPSVGCSSAVVRLADLPPVCTAVLFAASGEHVWSGRHKQAAALDLDVFVSIGGMQVASCRGAVQISRLSSGRATGVALALQHGGRWLFGRAPSEDTGADWLERTVQAQSLAGGVVVLGLSARAGPPPLPRVQQEEVQNEACQSADDELLLCARLKELQSHLAHKSTGLLESVEDQQEIRGGGTNHWAGAWLAPQPSSTPHSSRSLESQTTGVSVRSRASAATKPRAGSIVFASAAAVDQPSATGGGSSVEVDWRPAAGGAAAEARWPGVAVPRLLLQPPRKSMRPSAMG